MPSLDRCLTWMSANRTHVASPALTRLSASERDSARRDDPCEAKEEVFPTWLSIAYAISNGFNTLTFLSSANRKTSILWDVVGAHLSLQLCPNGSEAADD